MDTGDTSAVTTAEKQQNNSGLTGFQLHPENINKNGRPPKGHSITETIKAMMDEKPEIKKALGQKILQMALEGDITAMKTLWNYIDGMPTQRNETDLTTLGKAIQYLPSELLAKYGLAPNTESSSTG